MNRLLRIAESVYGAQARALIFEPLVADLQRERASNRSTLLRLRWWCAIASTFAITAPRATFAALPAAFVRDLAVRGLAFGVLAVGLQSFFARFTHAPSMPISLASTTPFVVLPLMWRIRVEALPPHQRRLLAVFVLGISMVIAAFPGATWPIRIALMAMPATAGAAGWRHGNPMFADRAGREKLPMNPWLQGVLIGSVLNVSAWPAAMTMGFAFNQFWPHAQLMTYIFGAAVYLSIRHRRTAATRA